MRITSIRSLPDVDTHDALQDADDEVKEHLLRDHIVSPFARFYVARHSQVVRIWKFLLHIALYQVAAQRAVKLIMLSKG